MLTEMQCRKAQPKEKTYYLFDEKGLYLEVTSKSSKYWRFKYRYAGKYKRIALGVYPEVSLKEARIKRDENRILITEGKDPLQERKTSKKEQIERSANTFENIALEWYEHKRRGALDTKDAKLELSRLKRHVFPYIGGIPIKQVKGNEIIEISRVMESENKLSEARKTRGILS